MLPLRTRPARLAVPVFLAACAAMALHAAPGRADPAPGQPTTVAGARAQVHRLYREAEVAAEKFNQARDRATRQQTRLRVLRHDLDRTRDRVSALRSLVAAGVVAQAQGQMLSDAAQAVLAPNPDAFVQRMVNLSQYRQQQADIRRRYTAETGQLALRADAARRVLSRVRGAERAAREYKATIDQKAADAAGLLRKLKREAAARRAALAASRAATAARTEEQTQTAAASPTTAPTPAAPVVSTAPSGSAGAAVSYALAQVGDAYVYGAAGPDAFDCSGLTMMAWAQAGVALPHSSSAQMASGTPVSVSALQPGDLVFYYSPVSHVALYVGGGQIVHAANPSTGVVTAPVLSMPVAGAVRPG